MSKPFNKDAHIGDALEACFVQEGLVGSRNATEGLFAIADSIELLAKAIDRLGGSNDGGFKYVGLAIEGLAQR